MPGTPLKKRGKVIPWQENPIILERMEVGLRAWSEAKAPSEQLLIINKWCAEQGFPTISARTMREDRERSLAFATEQLERPSQERLAEHVLRYKHAIRLIHEELQSNQHPVARSTLLGNLIKAQSEWARTTGDTVMHVEQKVTQKTDSEKAQVLIQVLVANYGSDEAHRIITEARRLEEGNETKVIDAISSRNSGEVTPST